MSGACQVCGASPAEYFEFRQVIGLLVVDRIKDVRGVFCKNCAQALGRELQSRTVATGWWGVLAIFRNLGAIAKNTANLNKAGRLGGPL